MGAPERALRFYLRVRWEGDVPLPQAGSRRRCGHEPPFQVGRKSVQGPAVSGLPSVGRDRDGHHPDCAARLKRLRPASADFGFKLSRPSPLKGWIT